MQKLASHLSEKWKEEIGYTKWITENTVYKNMKRKLKGVEVIQHDSPVWLGRQHLDVHIPNLNLAVEYQGKQHFEPVDFFGGQENFKRTVENDTRKAEICAAVGVSLEYIRYDEDIEARIDEIIEEYHSQ